MCNMYLLGLTVDQYVIKKYEIRFAQVPIELVHEAMESGGNVARAKGITINS
jgi:hypothetical protein